MAIFPTFRESLICPDFVSLLKVRFHLRHIRFGKEKGKRGRKSLQKRWEKREEIFFPLPFLYDVTGIALFKSDTKSGQIGLSKMTNTYQSIEQIM